MQEHNERMEPEMQESESGALIVLNVLLKIEGIEMQLRGQALVYFSQVALHQCKLFDDFRSDLRSFFDCIEYVCDSAVQMNDSYQGRKRVRPAVLRFGFIDSRKCDFNLLITKRNRSTGAGGDCSVQEEDCAKGVKAFTFDLALLICVATSI